MLIQTGLTLFPMWNTKEDDMKTVKIFVYNESQWGPNQRVSWKKKKKNGYIFPQKNESQTGLVWHDRIRSAFTAFL